MTTQLKPWQCVPRISCERCPSQATHRIVAATAELNVCEEHGHAFLDLSEDPAAAGALSCDTHVPVLGAQFCLDYGGAHAAPLRLPWRVWFSWFVVGALRDKLSIRRTR